MAYLKRMPVLAEITQGAEFMGTGMVGAARTGGDNGEQQCVGAREEPRELGQVDG